MTDLLASIEGSALAVWTRESPSIWAYSTILTLHTVGLAIVAGAHAVIDCRLLGIAPQIPLAALPPLFPIMWWAFALNLVTGILLFMADATAKAGQLRVLRQARDDRARVAGDDRDREILAPRDRCVRRASPSTPADARGAVAGAVGAAIVAGRLLAYQ